jgi:hypothetical protein
VQRAESARQARELRTRNAAVAAAAAGSRPATAGSAAGWIHPFGGRRGIRTGRSCVDQVKGRSQQPDSSGTARRRCGMGSMAGVVAEGRQLQGRWQGLNAGSRRPGTAGGNATNTLKVQLQREGGRSAAHVLAPLDGGSAASLSRTPMSPLDDQAQAAHGADSASFWLANQASHRLCRGIPAVLSSPYPDNRPPGRRLETVLAR